MGVGVRCEAHALGYAPIKALKTFMKSRSTLPMPTSATTAAGPWSSSSAASGVESAGVRVRSGCLSAAAAPSSSAPAAISALFFCARAGSAPAQEPIHPAARDCNVGPGPGEVRQ